MKIAVDFDGTIVEDAYPEVGKPRPFAIKTLQMLARKHRLILWTCREGKQLEDAVTFCQQNGIELYAVNKNYPEEDDNDFFCRKIDADIYIDDRSLGGLPSWGEIYQAIEGGESKEEKSKKWWKLW
ncbi:MAG: hypothetical protein IKR94_02710 [Bacteroidales bacterium]|nr:hypothetical protein [Bacteroidales bacterium]MBR4214207.1 hypothetical protein [Bacteroidales bacterium]